LRRCGPPVGRPRRAQSAGDPRRRALCAHHRRSAPPGISDQEGRAGLRRGRARGCQVLGSQGPQTGCCWPSGGAVGGSGPGGDRWALTGPLRPSLGTRPEMQHPAAPVASAGCSRLLRIACENPTGFRVSQAGLNPRPRFSRYGSSRVVSRQGDRKAAARHNGWVPGPAPSALDRRMAGTCSSSAENRRRALRRVGGTRWRDSPRSSRGTRRDPSLCPEVDWSGILSSAGSPGGGPRVRGATWAWCPRTAGQRGSVQRDGRAGLGTMRNSATGPGASGRESPAKQGESAGWRTCKKVRRSEKPLARSLVEWTCQGN